MRKQLPWFLVAILACVALLEVAGPERPPRAHAQVSDGGVIAKASLWNAAAPVISGNLLTTSIKPSSLGGSVLRIGVTLKVTGVFYLVEHNGAGTTQVYALNGGTALTAFQAYTFVWPMRAYDNDDPTTGTAHQLDYNFQLGTNGGVAALRGDEVLGPAD